MLRSSEVGTFLAPLLVISGVTASDVKLQHNRNNTTMAWVFRHDAQRMISPSRCRLTLQLIV